MKIARLSQTQIVLMVKAGARLPTAPGTAGQWYQFWVNPELDAKVRVVALKLHKQGKIRDENGNVVKLKDGPNGAYVPHYAVAKYALLQLVNGKKT